ncbi:hypothetical protein HDU82_006764 [Entophlyctis luteolus]|nr:hypothetical protein HDU82_006764 [Entophlyctis luteolus]
MPYQLIYPVWRQGQNRRVAIVGFLDGYNLSGTTLMARTLRDDEPDAYNALKGIEDETGIQFHLGLIGELIWKYDMKPRRLLGTLEPLNFYCPYEPYVNMIEYVIVAVCEDNLYWFIFYSINKRAICLAEATIHVYEKLGIEFPKKSRWYNASAEYLEEERKKYHSFRPPKGPHHPATF